MVHLYTILTILFLTGLISIIYKLIVKYHISKEDIIAYAVVIGSIGVVYIIIYLIIDTILFYYSPI